MGRIRPFARADVAQVAALGRLVFGGTGRLPAGKPVRYEAYLEEVFLEHPWPDPDVSSLVHEEGDGRITGFLGAIPRRMSMEGRTIRVAMSAQFMVDPSSRRGLAGVQLLRAFLAGPQDLSMTDTANDVSRRLWERLGGSTSLLHSMHWIRLLRPARFGLRLLARRQALGPLAVLADPLCRLADRAGAGRIAGLGAPPPGTTGEELALETVVEWLPRLLRRGVLRPVYEAQSLEWIVARASRVGAHGALRKVAVRRTADRQLIGWYIYHLKRGGTSEVLQIAAGPDAINDVCGHLFQDAWHGGALAVSGRLEPQCLQTFADGRCLLYRGGPWTLVHARDRELLQAIHRADAFLSRLEGEWCLRLDDAR